MVQERTLAYKEQQRLIALADRETADDRANDAARELETTVVPPPPPVRVFQAPRRVPAENTLW